MKHVKATMVAQLIRHQPKHHHLLERLHFHHNQLSAHRHKRHRSQHSPHNQHRHHHSQLMHHNPRQLKHRQLKRQQQKRQQQKRRQQKRQQQKLQQLERQQHGQPLKVVSTWFNFCTMLLHEYKSFQFHLQTHLKNCVGVDRLSEVIISPNGFHSKRLFLQTRRLWKFISPENDIFSNSSLFRRFSIMESH